MDLVVYLFTNLFCEGNASDPASLESLRRRIPAGIRRCGNCQRCIDVSADLCISLVFHTPDCASCSICAKQEAEENRIIQESKVEIIVEGRSRDYGNGSLLLFWHAPIRHYRYDALLLSENAGILRTQERFQYNKKCV